MSPVTHMFEPPSTRCPVVLEFVTCISLTEDLSSSRRPQTRGEQTTCVTLSRMEGSSGSSDAMVAISWSSRRLILVVTEVGEGGLMKLSMREHGGNVGSEAEGGGSAGGSSPS